MRENDETTGLDEAELLRRLPHETRPPAALHERVRADLLRTGRLQPRHRFGSAIFGLRWIPAAAALALVFFFGFLVGGSRSASDRPPAQLVGDGTAVLLPVPVTTGARVQRLGSEYIDAIATLAEPGVPRSSEWAEAREAAFSVLRGAAEQLGHLPGQDPEVLALLRALRAQEDSSAQEGWL